MGLKSAALGKSSAIELLEESAWLSLEATHDTVVMPWVEAYRDRRARRTRHPVHDFLFEYYQINRRLLTQWRPMAWQRLCGDAAQRFLEDERYLDTGDGVGVSVKRMSEKERLRLRWVYSLIAAAKLRAPRFNCFGLHEWAMVYRADEIRHEKTPLRVSPAEVEAIVEGNTIRCSHFDAFRFFTPEAIPLNELQPGRDEREQNEQFGCVHFNMDLYKWSVKLSPWVGSELIRACFLLAMEARELDMRASPYDLSEYGYEPIRIETASGREQYRIEQERIYRAGSELSDALLEACRYLLRELGELA